MGKNWGYKDILHDNHSERPWASYPHYWPKFEYTGGRVEDILTFFFKDRPLYTWRLLKNDVVLIEPSDSSHQTYQEVLCKPFDEPVEAQYCNEEGVWIVLGNALDGLEEDALARLHPGRVYSRLPIRLETDPYGCQDMLACNEFNLNGFLSLGWPFSITSFEDFILKWLAADGRAFVVLDSFGTWSDALSINRDAPAGNMVVCLDSWNPKRCNISEDELVSDLSIDESILPEQIEKWRIRSKNLVDAMRELTRRYCFKSKAVVTAVKKVNLYKQVKDIRMRRDIVIDSLLSLDAETFRPLILDQLGVLSNQEREKATSFPDGYPSYNYSEENLTAWGYLAQVNDPELKRFGVEGLKAMNIQLEDKRNPQTIAAMGENLKTEELGPSPGDGGAFKELRLAGTPEAAAAATSFVYNDVWDTYNYGPELLVWVINSIPNGHDAAVKRLIDDLDTANDTVRGRIHQTLLILTGDVKARSVVKNDGPRILSYWKEWQKEQVAKSAVMVPKMQE